MNCLLLVGILLAKDIKCLKEVCIFLCLIFFVNEISMDMLEEKLMEDIDLDLEVEEDIQILDDR